MFACKYRSVFDVTKGRSHYGPGGGYNHFAGRFVTFDTPFIWLGYPLNMIDGAMRVACHVSLWTLKVHQHIQGVVDNLVLVLRFAHHKVLASSVYQ